MESEKIILTKQASDGLIQKEIQHGQVRTATFLDGKQGYVTTRDIKRLGYKNSTELIEHLKSQGYCEA